jgi:DNA-directed RNA polymerase subunit RPC12/RpoP
MADYQKYINALRKCAKEHENDSTFTGHIIVADLCRDTANLLEELEQEPKTGHWIAYEVRLPDRTILNYRCSVCGRKLIGYNTETLSEAPYCHCGAKMIEPQESEDKA